MGNYDQKNQSVGNQYNAGRDVNIFTANKEDYSSVLLAELTRGSHNTLMSNRYNARFKLAKQHIIEFEHNRQLVGSQCRLLVDNAEIWRTKIIALQYADVTHLFQLEEVNCEFRFKAELGVCHGEVWVGPHQVLKID